MRRIVAVLAALVVVIVAGILVYAATKPDSFSVQRSASIQAPPEKIAALIQDFRAWAGWSPYEKKDPAMKRTFEGPSAGKGAVYEWDGDKAVGAGRMEIVEVTPSAIVIKLDFRRPFEGHNTARFTLEPRGDSTTVTWMMYGPSPYVAKVMSSFFDMDKMIGTDFEAGLASLKSLAEK
ncbi:Polyketide cyclase / dehydrase and lipid transport [Enhydrobacter aerosaccus]|uniref:Polyketide cyclase / dehydrase and lipid transport n=1 Tax=Enhydrobacter aerosaccus TaxID=225324 RepID=A0A1T4R2H6_9HYPH|nr:SRPBCC family protein [Enhydrobacter aerosaccus]SKA09808.1 Polyketide cyclase / dehydrase and lipid transport [Enhydrobacter aerosaccus]